MNTAALTDTRSGEAFALGAQTLIGRSRTCDLRLSNLTASSHHALMRWAENSWQIRDLGSRNGTFVKGARIAGEWVTLAPDVCVGFGSSEGWRLCYQENISAPEPSGTVQTWNISVPTISTIALEFSVSRDEEFVKLTAVHNQNRIPIPPRSYHYLLLTLARLRLQDEAADPADSAEHGWVEYQEMARMLRISDSQVYLQVHRARKQLAMLGIADANRLIESRPGTRLFRLGVQTLSNTVC